MGRENNARCNAELRAELDEVLASRHASECAVALQTERLALEAAEEAKERNRYVVAREEFAALVSDTRDREGVATVVKTKIQRFSFTCSFSWTLRVGSISDT